MEPNTNAKPETKPNSLPLAECCFRLQETDHIYCSAVARIAELKVEQCPVGADACRTCMSRTVPPETPNDVVASMTIVAVRKNAPDRIESIMQQMRPHLKTSGGTPAARVTAADLPCVHRGELLRVIECEMCGAVGTSVEVHECLHPEVIQKECTASRWSNDPTKMPNKHCLTCESRTVPVQIEKRNSRPGGESQLREFAKYSDRGGFFKQPPSAPAAPDSRPAPYLSIVMATHTDYDGVWFTIEILRSFFAEILAETNAEIIVVDTAPESPHGKAVRDFIINWCNGDDGDGGGTDAVRGRYIPAAHLPGTAAPRDEAIRQARGEVVLCLDCHVILQPGSLSSLVEYFRSNPESIDLIHGPMLHDNFRVAATHMRPEWGSDNMYGKWDTAGHVSPDGKHVTQTAPFEIPMHGLGLFACRKAAWQGLNPLFRGFGGEEGYIHAKFRQAGGKVVCLPGLKWLHRFGRPGGIPYRNATEDRFANYLIGSMELGAGDFPTVPEIIGRFEGLSKELIGRVVTEVMAAAQ